MKQYYLKLKNSSEKQIEDIDGKIKSINILESKLDFRNLFELKTE